MKLVVSSLVILTILFSALPIQAQYDEIEVEDYELRDYIIGPGDVLEISIWKEEGLTKSITVRPDGKSSFPLIGEFKAANLTVSQLTENITDSFRKYFPDPIVSITIEEMNSLQIYVIGRVKGPGRFLYNSKINVLQALAMAEGLTPFADKKEIFIYREIDGQKIKIPFNYSEVVKGENLEQNITLERGDIIIVP
jgi:polysaccharide export outer membrane protein